MTLRHLQIFRQVCASGCNATKAAEALHMTQPAVSLAIKELEQYYGLPLFDRMGRRLQLTDGGKQALQYAIHICDLFADMETQLRNREGHGTLRVGASITIGSQFLPGYIRAFGKAYPGVDVRAVVEQAGRLERKLLANELDLALSEGMAHDGNILSQPYMEDTLCVICPRDWGWEPGRVLTISEFQSQRFLLREQGSGTREVFDRVMEQAGLRVTPIWEAMSTTALINAVVNGLGIAVLPRRMVQPALERGLVQTVEVEKLSFVRSFYIMRHKDKYLTESARAFLNLCQNSDGERQ